MTEPVVLGRASHGWAVPWDDRVSRKHAKIIWDGRSLNVAKLNEARNPIFFRGVRKDEFEAGIGDHFVIGQTTFSIVDQRIRVLATDEDQPAMTEHSFAASELRKSRFRDADERIEVLSKLPEIIRSSSSDEELFHRMVNLLLEGIPKATFVAIVADDSKLIDGQNAPAMSTPLRTKKDDGPSASSSTDPATSDGDVPAEKSNARRPDTIGLSESLDREITEGGIRVFHWDSRSLTGPQFTPSAGLIRQALRSGESVLHVWSRVGSASPSYTQSENVDWAFCTPLTNEACPGWAIYVAGDFSTLVSGTIRDATMSLATDLQDELKFTELVGTTLVSLRQTRMLQRRQDGLRPFFAPVVRQALLNSDPDRVLAPREANVSVLFCDLRGFSRQSEESSDRLLELLRRVSDALGVMTHHILESDGVVGDFHGDAAMGFWGWPFESNDTVMLAARAALAIQAEFEAAAVLPDHPLAGFRAGLGIASGRAVAGRIGTTDQVKVTVFGPVVNLASRLESMTKQLQAPILIDEVTAERLRSSNCREICRVRRVARLLPVGIQKSLMVSELLSPVGPDAVLLDEHIAAYEKAVDLFQEGDWSNAFRFLHQVPAEDRVKDFLTVFIAQHGRTPPADWPGFIAMPEK
jgi:adenylate cyclase